MTHEAVLKMLGWGPRPGSPGAKLMSSRADGRQRHHQGATVHLTPRKLTRLRMAGRLSHLSETGGVSKLSTTILIIRRWPSTRNTRVASIRVELTHHEEPTGRSPGIPPGWRSQAGLHGDDLARHHEAFQQKLGHEAERYTDEQLLPSTETADGEQFHLGHGGQQGAMSEGNGGCQPHANVRRSQPAAEHRHHHQQAAHPGKGPEHGRQPLRGHRSGYSSCRRCETMGLVVISSLMVANADTGIQPTTSRIWLTIGWKKSIRLLQARSVGAGPRARQGDHETGQELRVCSFDGGGGLEMATTSPPSGSAGSAHIVVTSQALTEYVDKGFPDSSYRLLSIDRLAPPQPEAGGQEARIRFQPSTMTNSISLNGSRTSIGDSIIIPMAIGMLATTGSMTRKGQNSMKPIWNAVWSSLVTKAGISTHSGVRWLGHLRSLSP